jgi:para-aminobenzoate synthetase component 1
VPPPETLPAAVASCEVPAPPAWDALVATLAETRGFWLLESALAGRPLGRFSFAGAGPCAIVRARADRVELEPLRADAPRPWARRRTLRGDPLAGLRELLPRAAAETDARVPFTGGAVGWLAYELAAQLEGVAVAPLADLGLPDACLLLVDRGLAFEHATGRLHAAALGVGRDGVHALGAASRAAEGLATRVARGASDPFEAGRRRPRPPAGPAPPGPEPLRLRDAATGLRLGAFFDAEAYGKAVERIRELIAAGEVYQANLTHRMRVETAADPWRIYTELRRVNPAPFAAWLELPELAVVGSSPERFVRVEPDGRVETRPIKGTRPRGTTPDEDRALRAALAASGKDRAENVMIVDLARHDLGRVCRPGSVEVPDLFAIETYATVFQMVSTVRGRLRPGRDALDLVRAAFPPGSMTGAPKRAALEILARLEPVRRGVYSGALGWLDARGGADLSVVIRTLLCRPGRAWLHVGGGVVLDSDPAAEWEEARAKARALLDAVARAG